MVQGYFSLEEAAKILGMPVDTLSRMAQKRQIRAFADGGSWKFRHQDIEELRRQNSLVSDPDVHLSGDSIHGNSGDSASIMDDDGDVIIDDSGLSGMGLGLHDALDTEPTMVGMRSRGDQDSNVHLIINDDPDTGDSDIRLVASPPKSTSKGTPKTNTPKTASAKAADSGIGLGSTPERTPTDSDIRLSFDDADLGADKLFLDDDVAAPVIQPDRTEEFHLPGVDDLESTSAFAGNANAGDNDDLAFNLSGDDLKEFDLDSAADFGLDVDDAPPPKTAKGGKPKPVEEEDDSDFQTFALAEDDDDSIDLGAPATNLPRSGPASGINLATPADSGISLEESNHGMDSEFELSLDSEEEDYNLDSDEEIGFKDDDEDSHVAKVTPPSTKRGGAKAPASSKAVASSDSTDSDFELALDESIEEDTEAESGSDVVAIEEDDEEADDYDDYDDYEDAPAASAGAGAVPSRMAPVTVAAAQAPWNAGVLVMSLLTSLLLCLGGAMMVEIMRNTHSAHEPYALTGTWNEWVAGFGAKK